MVAVELHRKAEIDRSLAAICKVGCMYTRDEESQGSPVVSIHFVSLLIDDAGHVNRRGRATDHLLTLLSRFDQLRELTLEEADVTDAGLAHLSRLKTLRRLSLRGTRITDAGVSQLAQCPALTRIDLRETRVTGEGIRWLRRALPETDIVSDVNL
jgi:Leucine Rich repeat